MKNDKTELRFFSIFQWEKEQDYLRQQNKLGWKFSYVNCIGLYHFEKCQPEDVVYQLDYNPEGISHKDEYVQLFRDCGWEYLQDYFGYSYFRKPASEMNGEETIFCDDDSRIDMMRRVWRGRMVPLLIIFFLLILPNLYTQSHIDYPANHALTIVFLVLFFVYLFTFVYFGLQFWKYQKSLH